MNRRRHGLPRLAGDGRRVVVGSVATGAAGWLLGYPELMVICLLGALAIGLGLAATIIRPRLTIERRFEPIRATVGGDVAAVFDVRNLARWPSPPFVAIDHIGERAIEVPVGFLAPRRRRLVPFPLPTDRRGRFDVGPVRVEQRDPLGLVRRDQPHASTGTLWIHPRSYPAVLPPRGSQLDIEGSLRSPAQRGSTTFAALRPYVAGDDPRHVHWKATARTGNLIVRDFIDTSQPLLTVALDGRPRWEEGAYEEAVSVVASLVVAARRATRSVSVLLPGEQASVLAETLDPLDRLAAIAPSSLDDVAELLAMVERAEPGGALVVVTADDTLAALRRFVAQRSRFGPLVVVQIAAQTVGRTTGTSRRHGVTTIDAATALDAVAAWNHLIAGRNVA